MVFEKFTRLFSGDSPEHAAHWRNFLPGDIFHELNSLVAETHKYRESYQKASHLREAQLWLALSEISLRLRAVEESLGISEETFGEKVQEELPKEVVERATGIKAE